MHHVQTCSSAWIKKRNRLIGDSLCLASPKEKADPEAFGVRHLSVTCRFPCCRFDLADSFSAGLLAGSSPQILGAASEVQAPIQNVELIGRLYVPWC